MAPDGTSKPPIWSSSMVSRVERRRWVQPQDLPHDLKRVGQVLQFLESWCMVSEDRVELLVQPRSDFWVRPDCVPGRRHGSRGRLMAGEEHGDRFIPQQGFRHGLACVGVARLHEA